MMSRAARYLSRACLSHDPGRAWPSAQRPRASKEQDEHLMSKHLARSILLEASCSKRLPATPLLLCGTISAILHNYRVTTKPSPVDALSKIASSMFFLRHDLMDRRRGDGTPTFPKSKEAKAAGLAVRLNASMQAGNYNSARRCRRESSGPVTMRRCHSNTMSLPEISDTLT